MNLKFYLITILLVLLFPAQNKAEEEEEAEEAPKSCITFTIELLTDTVKVIVKCLAKFRPKRITEYATRAYCIIKCILQEYGTVDAEGNLDSIGAAFFFDETFPTEVKEQLLPRAQECFPLADQFNPKDYWCKSYAPLVICIVKAFVAGVLPYILGCFVTPVIGILLEVLRAIAPDQAIATEIEEMRREYNKHRGVYCFNHNCTQKYRISKTRGGSTMILYHRNMTEIGKGFKTPNGFHFTSFNKNVIESPMNDTSIISINYSPNNIIIEDSVYNNTLTINSNDTQFYDNNNDTYNSDYISVANISDQLPKIINSDGPPIVHSDFTPSIIELNNNYTIIIDSENIPSISNENPANNNDGR